MSSARPFLVGFIRRELLFVCVSLSMASAFAQKNSTSSDTCWTTRNITFPAGDPDDVLKVATSFLVSVEAQPKHPYWPGGTSGITIGVGWDLGQHSEADFRKTWSSLDADSISKLSVASGKTGESAHELLQELKTAVIPEEISSAVLQTSLREREYPQTLRLFPGTDRLPVEFQVVLISILFNRGSALGHDPDWRTADALDKRWEMRKLQGDVARSDLFAIYIRLGTMKRIWENDAKQRGLPIRRRDEQHLIRPYIDQVLKWEQQQEDMKASGLPSCSSAP